MDTGLARVRIQQILPAEESAACGKFNLESIF